MPRRRKIATVVEDDANDSDAEPVPNARAAPKKAVAPRKAYASQINGNRTILSKSVTLAPIQEQSTIRPPMFELFEKAQANESLHGKYIKEMVHMCSTVSTLHLAAKYYLPHFPLHYADCC